MRQHMILLCVSIKNARAQIKKKKSNCAFFSHCPCPFPNAQGIGDWQQLR